MITLDISLISKYTIQQLTSSEYISIAIIVTCVIYSTIKRLWQQLQHHCRQLKPPEAANTNCKIWNHPYGLVIAALVFTSSDCVLYLFICSSFLLFDLLIVLSRHFPSRTIQQQRNATGLVRWGLRIFLIFDFFFQIQDDRSSAYYVRMQYSTSLKYCPYFK